MIICAAEVIGLGPRKVEASWCFPSRAHCPGSDTVAGHEREVDDLRHWIHEVVVVFVAVRPESN